MGNSPLEGMDSWNSGAGLGPDHGFSSVVPDSNTSSPVELVEVQNLTESEAGGAAQDLS